MKQTVSPELLAPGAKLAEAVCDASGAVLLPKETELDEHLISTLCTKKIAEVVIVIERTPTEQAAFDDELKAGLDRRFQLASGHPLMDSLKQMILEYRCGE
ncbi:MAG: hypothetical protein L3J28_05490 [Candidatus Polarisedimenticolaceae bacterium]|nr:hypothetical protein [Candidatus Polarisedimenticolaceae bacterium]